MLSWRRGREVALARREADAIPLQTFIDELSGPHPPLRVPGTAIYFTTRQDVLPAALSLNLKHNGVVHQNLMFLRIATARVPKVTDSDRLSAKELAPGLEQVEIDSASRKGQMYPPPSPRILQNSGRMWPKHPSSWAGRSHPVASSGCAALAGKALRIHDAQRGTRARLLSDTAREGRGMGTKVEM